MKTTSPKDFAVFILTHGRPTKQKTIRSLKRSGYTGPIYLILDNEDETIDQYQKIYGDKVIVFDKLAISKTFDCGDNFNDRRTIAYARNATFKIAEDLGIKYFIQLDDDYHQFDYRFNSTLEYCHKPIKNLDKVFGYMLDYYKTIPALTIAMAQGGDYIGGKNGTWAQELKLRRKAMNTFICSTDRPFQLVGRINNDVNTYVLLGSRGHLLLTIPNVSITQESTQKTAGGMSDVYADSGTYLKSFYSIMYNPSSVRIAEMGDKHKRIHHKVLWNNAVPKILKEEQRKNNKIERELSGVK